MKKKWKERKSKKKEKKKKKRKRKKDFCQILLPSFIYMILVYVFAP